MNEKDNKNYSSPDPSFFEGEILHPALDIKNGILVLGFRYTTKDMKRDDIFLVSRGGILEMRTGPTALTFEHDGMLYSIEKGVRLLPRIEMRWSTRDMRSLCEEYRAMPPVLAPKIVDIFREIVKLAKRHFQMECEADYFLLAAFTIATYFFPAFSAFPFVHIKGPKHSGKSQILTFLEQLCFNAKKARPTKAALGDTVDSLRGTYLIDQCDSIGNPSNGELLDLLTDSYRKSGGRRRFMDMEKGRKVIEQEVYGPKAFASIGELPEDLRDRCLIIPLTRSRKNFPDPEDDSGDWKGIRNALYRVLVSEYEIVALNYKAKRIAYKNDPRTVGRFLELWLPLEIMLQMFGVDQQASEARKRFSELYGYAEFEPSELEEAVARVILEKIDGEGKEDIVLSPKSISEAINTEMFWTDDDPGKRSSKVGKIIGKYNLSSEKLKRSKEGVRYLFKKERVGGVYDVYFKNTESPAPPTPGTDSPLSASESEMQGDGVGSGQHSEDIHPAPTPPESDLSEDETYLSVDGVGQKAPFDYQP